MRKLTTFFTLIVVALLMFCGPGFADTVLTPDSVVFGEDQLKEIVFTEVTGPTDDDTFPDVAWCEAACAASNTPMDKCNTTSNACRPDGFVPKEDSPYHTVKVADMGQRQLYIDMRNGQVLKYEGYVDGSWYGRSWDELSSYRKMLQHMTDQTTRQKVGWNVIVRFDTEVSPQQHYDWATTVDLGGFDDPAAILFRDGEIELNTKYLKGSPEAGTVHLSSSMPYQIWATMFVPSSDLDVYDRLVLDLEAWNAEPILQKNQAADGVITYRR